MPSGAKKGETAEIFGLIHIVQKVLLVSQVSISSDLLRLALRLALRHMRDIVMEAALRPLPRPGGDRNRST